MATIPSIAMIPSGVKASKLYSVLPTDGTGDFTTTRASVANRVNESGLIEEVAANVPRLDYSDGTCPSLLLEGTATNVVVYSEDFTQTNWNSASGVQLSSTTTLTPSGSTNAVRIKNVGGVNNDLRSVVSITSGLTYTNSIYMRRVSGVGSVILKHVNGGGSSINELTSEWQKFSSTVLSDSTNGRFYLEVSTLNDEIEVWGASTEQNSYSTSYIKTIGTAQTRVADTASGAGSSTVINSTEGVLYAEIKYPSNDIGSGKFSPISISGGSTNFITFRHQGGVINRLSIFIYVNNVEKFVFLTTVYDLNNYVKIAVLYSSSGSKIYINGAVAYTDAINSSFPINTLTEVEGFQGGDYFKGNVKSLQVYKTALSDAELTTLTTI